jgi:hypothetical protein
LHGSRSITSLGSARGAGNSFVHSTAFEIFARAGFLANLPDHSVEQVSPGGRES